MVGSGILNGSKNLTGLAASSLIGLVPGPMRLHGPAASLRRRALDPLHGLAGLHSLASFAHRALLRIAAYAECVACRLIISKAHGKFPPQT